MRPHKAELRVVTAAPEDEPTAAIVERAARGDHKAFATLYRRHADMAFALLTRLVGPVSEREDLLQEVFVRLHRALPRYRGNASLSTFLYKITVRVAYDHLRARKRRPRPVDVVDHECVLSADGAGAPRAELADVLRFLDALTPEQRIAFVLREVLDYRYPEIAELVGCFETTARMRVTAANRALARLTRQGSPR